MPQNTTNNDDKMMLPTFLNEKADEAQNYQASGQLQDEDIIGELIYIDDAISIENLSPKDRASRDFLDTYTFFQSIAPSHTARKQVRNEEVAPDSASEHSSLSSVPTIQESNPFKENENILKRGFKTGFKKEVASAIIRWEQKIYRPTLLPEQQSESLREKIHSFLNSKKKDIGLPERLDLISSILPQYTNQHIPKNLIYVWTGKSIKPEYLEEIRAVAIHSRAMGFRVLLYVTHPNLFLATQEKLLDTAKIANLHIHNIKDLTDFALDYFRDPQNFNNQALGAFLVNCIEQERIGLHNYGSYSDIVRLLALLKHGGYYLDTDTMINKKATAKPSGDHFFARTKFESQSSHLGLLYYFEGNCAGNNVIASLQNHPIICLSLLFIAKNYLEASTHLFNQQTVTLGKSQIVLDVTEAEAKRAPYKDNFKDQQGRVQLTIKMTGPSCLKKSSLWFLYNQLEHIIAQNCIEHENLRGLDRFRRSNYLAKKLDDPSLTSSLFAIEMMSERELQLGGLDVHFDGTWYKRSSQRSFEC